MSLAHISYIFLQITGAFEVIIWLTILLPDYVFISTLHSQEKYQNNTQLSNSTENKVIFNNNAGQITGNHFYPDILTCMQANCVAFDSYRSGNSVDLAAYLFIDPIFYILNILINVSIFINAQTLTRQKSFILGGLLCLYLFSYIVQLSAIAIGTGGFKRVFWLDYVSFYTLKLGFIILLTIPIALLFVNYRKLEKPKHKRIELQLTKEPLYEFLNYVDGVCVISLLLGLRNTYFSILMLIIYFTYQGSFLYFLFKGSFFFLLFSVAAYIIGGIVCLIELKKKTESAPHFCFIVLTLSHSLTIINFIIYFCLSFSGDLQIYDKYYYAFLPQDILIGAFAIISSYIYYRQTRQKHSLERRYYQIHNR